MYAIARLLTLKKSSISKNKIKANSFLIGRKHSLAFKKTFITSHKEPTFRVHDELLVPLNHGQPIKSFSPATKLSKIRSAFA